MSAPVLIGFAGVLVAAVATGLLAGRCVRQPRIDFILWTAATLALTVSLAAQSVGFASGFGPATFRAVQLCALLLAPLWLAWGLAELVWASEAARFGARLACSALTVVGGVILATDPLSGQPFGKSWPLASAHYQPVSHYTLDVVQAVAVIIAAVSAGLAVARARNGRPWAGTLAGIAPVGVAVLLTAGLRFPLPGRSVYPLVTIIAAALVWFGATRISVLPGRAGRDGGIAAADDHDVPGTRVATNGHHRPAGTEGRNDLEKFQGPRRPGGRARPGGPGAPVSSGSPGTRASSGGPGAPASSGRLVARYGPGGRYGPSAPPGPGESGALRGPGGQPGAGGPGDPRGPGRPGVPRGPAGSPGSLTRGPGNAGEPGDPGWRAGPGLRQPAPPGRERYRGGAWPGGPGPDARPLAPHDAQPARPPGTVATAGAGAAAAAAGTVALAGAEAGSGPQARPAGSPTAATARPYGRILIFTLLDDRAAEFDRLAEQTAEEVRTGEPDTLVYVIHLVPNAPMQRIFYEIYRDRAAFDLHESQPYIQRFAAERRSCVLATNVIELRLKYAKVAPLPSAAPASPPLTGTRGQLPPGQPQRDQGARGGRSPQVLQPLPPGPDRRLPSAGRRDGGT